MTYAGSRSYDIEAGFNGYNEPSAAFQAQCDVTLGGSRSFCDELLPNPFFGVAGFEGTTRFTRPDALALRVEPAVPGVHRLQSVQDRATRTIGKLTYDSAQFVAEQAVRQGRHRERQLHLRAAVDRDRRPDRIGTPTSTRSRFS